MTAILPDNSIHSDLEFETLYESVFDQLMRYFGDTTGADDFTALAEIRCCGEALLNMAESPLSRARARALVESLDQI